MSRFLTGATEIPRPDPGFQGPQPTEGIGRNDPGFASSVHAINNGYGRQFDSGDELVAWAGGVGEALAPEKGLAVGRGIVVLVKKPMGKGLPESQITEALAPEGTTKLTIVNYNYPTIYMSDTNGKSVSLNLENLKFGSGKAPAGLKPVDLTLTGQ